MCTGYRVVLLLAGHVNLPPGDISCNSISQLLYIDQVPLVTRAAFQQCALFCLNLSPDLLLKFLLSGVSISGSCVQLKLFLSFLFFCVFRRLAVICLLYHPKR